MRREELCSVELLNLKTVCSRGQHFKKQKTKWIPDIIRAQLCTLPEEKHFVQKTK